MKLSGNTLFIEDFPDPHKYLTFNTRTQAQVVIDKTLKGVLDALPGNNHDQPTLEALGALERMGILISDSTDEQQIIEEWFHTIKTESSEIDATVLTTYDCNFACPYCIENGVKNKIYMDEPTAQRTVSYITGRVDSASPKRLSVNFYGGEPLLNPKAIRIVARGLKEFTEARELPFSYSITTNGALLTPEIVKELKEYGLKSVKITIDGTKEFHNRKRPFKNGRGSFDIILKNLMAAAADIEVDVGGNFDRENLASIYELLDYLGALGLTDKLRSVEFKPIFLNHQDRIKVPHGSDLGCVFFEPAVMKSMIDLKKATLDRGFKANTGLGINLCSMVMSGSVFIIDPVGKLYRCPAFVGHEEYVVGNIDQPGREDFSAKDLWKRCSGCVYVPLCGDGCLYAAYIRYGDINRLNCQKSYMEYMVKEQLKLNYRHSKKTS